MYDGGVGVGCLFVRFRNTEKPREGQSSGKCQMMITVIVRIWSCREAHWVHFWDKRRSKECTWIVDGYYITFLMNGKSLRFK